MKSLYYRMALLVAIITSSCVKDNFDETVPNQDQPNQSVDELAMADLTVPAGFEFSTIKKVTIDINDFSDTAIYDVYAYNDDYVDEGVISYQDEEGEMVTTNLHSYDLFNQLVFTGSPNNSTLQHQITIPSYYEKVYVRRKLNGAYSSAIVDIVDGAASYTYTKKAKQKSAQTVQNYLYAMASGGLHQIDLTDGSATLITTLPSNSVSMGLDQQNKKVYLIANTDSRIMTYDIENDTWAADIPTTLPTIMRRAEYNPNDGLLYVSGGPVIYKVDPTNGTTISSHNILGLNATNENGGDFAIGNDGTLYVGTHKSIYTMTLNANGEYETAKLYSENLPIAIYGITVDSENNLWISGPGGANGSDVLISDVDTGGWEYRYGGNADNNTVFTVNIGDISTYKVFSTDPLPSDQDNDGIDDVDDAYPNDPAKAFIGYSPSRYGKSSLSFEDLWPSAGDYDFNDTSLNYQMRSILNSANEVVQLEFDIEVKANGASFTNAVGIEFEGTTPAEIASVTGTVLTENFIQLNPNGTEAGQQWATVILYDNNLNMLNTSFMVTITFTNPISELQLGSAPFNPFLIVDKERANEVHLPYASPTDLGADQGTDYVTEQGLPFAIHLVHEFKVPKEKTPINQAYNFFNQWVTSGGTTKPDWYKNSSGYRNTNNLQ